MLDIEGLYTEFYSLGIIGNRYKIGRVLSHGLKPVHSIVRSSRIL